MNQFLPTCAESGPWPALTVLCLCAWGSSQILTRLRQGPVRHAPRLRSFQTAPLHFVAPPPWNRSHLLAVSLRSVPQSEADGDWFGCLSAMIAARSRIRNPLREDGITAGAARTADLAALTDLVRRRVFPATPAATFGPSADCEAWRADQRGSYASRVPRVEIAPCEAGPSR